jgi:hypothetical protein
MRGITIDSFPSRWQVADWRIGLFVLLAALLALNVVVSHTTSIEGDGNEYFMMSNGLLARGDPALQRQDVAALDRALRRTGNGAGLPAEVLRAPQLEWNGYYHASNGKQYSYHYWLYSLVNVPALAASRLFGFAPTSSFLITNSLLILLAAFVVLFKARMEIGARIPVLLMFLLSGTSFYLDWSGPEVFTACGVLIGCTLLLSERPLFAALAFATAAQQNPSAGLLAIASLVFWMWRAVMDMRDGRASFRKLAPEFLGAAASVVFSMQSPLFYWARFGVPSLLIKEGFSENKFITANRLVSYYFDLDQGLVRGAPFLLGALLAAFLIALTRPTAARRSLLVGLACVAASIAIAIPTLTTATWVAGCRVFLRYPYWGSVPLWFATAYFLRAASPRLRLSVIGLALVCQAAWIVGVYRFDGADVSYREHSWLARKVIEHFPEHYNPDPFVFTVRTVKSWVLPFQPAPGLTYYFEHPGRISKLLYHPESRGNWIPECAATPADLEKLPGVERIRADGGWAYLNLGQACPIQNGSPPYALWLSYSDRFSPIDAKGIFFGSGGNWEQHVWENQTGWGKTEEWGTWTDGKAANISFLLAQPPGGALSLKLEGVGRASPGQSHCEAAVNVNGIFVGTARFSQAERTTIVLAIPPGVLTRSSGIFHVRLLLRGTGAPAIGVISLNVLNVLGVPEVPKQ